MTLQRALPTRQERSRRTLDRILAATERLLAKHDFESLTMQQIADEAGRAVGTVYGRVPSKAALLACLFDRFMEWSSENLTAVVEDPALARAPLALRAAKLVELTVNLYSTRRAVVRALARDLFFLQRHDSAQFRRQITADFRKLARFLAEAPDAIPHPDREAACSFALAAMLAMAQNRIVFGERSSIRLKWPLSQLRDQLTHGFVSYLQSKPASTTS